MAGAADVDVEREEPVEVGADDIATQRIVSTLSLCVKVFGQWSGRKINKPPLAPAPRTVSHGLGGDTVAITSLLQNSLHSTSPSYLLLF